MVASSNCMKMDKASRIGSQREGCEVVGRFMAGKGGWVLVLLQVFQTGIVEVLPAFALLGQTAKPEI